MGVLLQNDKPVGGISADVIESIDFDLTTTAKDLPGAINELDSKTSTTVSVTQAQYDALPSTKLSDDIAYYITDGTPTVDNTLWNKVGTDTLSTTSKNCSGAINELYGGWNSMSDAITAVNLRVDSVNSSLENLIEKTTTRSGTISETISAGSSKTITFAIETIQGYTPLGVLGLSKGGTNHDNVTISAFYITGGNVVVRLHNNSTSSITITSVVADILHVKTFN